MLAVPLILALQALATPLTPADTQVILNRARAAQAAFERVRRYHLPRTSAGSQDHCDELIADHCFTYGDPNDAWKPPKEDDEVIAARDSLITVLSNAARALPENEWIAGQRVRYIVEERAITSARVAAGACRPVTSWWCLVLTGYAAHAAEDYRAAETAYDRGLAAMTTEQRCRWTDISLLLPDAPGPAYRRLNCTARDSLERRFWWLADPLYLTPGNERRTEHFSRLVHVRFEENAPSISPDTWKSYLAPWLIRYGWPAGWERVEGSTMSQDPALTTVTHYGGPAQVFEPPWASLDRPESITPDDLPLRPDPARTGYVPTYAERFDSLRSQVAVFRRGRTAAIVAGYDLSSDSIPPEAPAIAGLFLQRSERDSALSVQSKQTARGVLQLTSVMGSGLLSLETMALDGKRAGRVRYWLTVQPRDPLDFAVSDILLLSRPDSLPVLLDSAVVVARTRSSARRGETVGLFWEVYGAGAGTVPLSVRLTMVKEGTGFFHRAARAIGLGGKQAPTVALSWTQRSEAGAEATPIAIALDLGGNAPGRYTLQLEVTGPGGKKAGTQRRLTIEDDAFGP